MSYCLDPEKFQLRVNGCEALAAMPGVGGEWESSCTFVCVVFGVAREHGHYKDKKSFDRWRAVSVHLDSNREKFGS